MNQPERTLLLVRHAKSSWKYPGLDDHDRPLNKRGKRDAPLMAAVLAAREPAIQTIYTSTAVRARTLAEQISEASGAALVDQGSLYTFSASNLLQALAGITDEASCVAVVGHNPAITAVANHLTGEQIANVPTSGIVSIAVAAGRWSDLAPGNCTLSFFDFPKNQR